MMILINLNLYLIYLQSQKSTKNFYKYFNIYFIFYLHLFLLIKAYLINPILTVRNFTAVSVNLSDKQNNTFFDIFKISKGIKKYENLSLRYLLTNQMAYPSLILALRPKLKS